MFVKDEFGNEKEMEILFTFDHQDKKYVVFQDMNSSTGEVFASSYTEEGELLPIENEAEWQVIEEVIQAFMEDDNG